MLKLRGIEVIAAARNMISIRNANEHDIAEIETMVADFGLRIW